VRKALVLWRRAADQRGESWLAAEALAQRRFIAAHASYAEIMKTAEQMLSTWRDGETRTFIKR